MAYGPVPGPYGAPLPPPPMPGRSRLRPKPKVRGSIALPLIGILLVLACIFVLPWAHTGGQYVTLPDVWSKASDLPWYLAGGWASLLVPGTLIAFAGTMDSKVFRILIAVLGGLGGLSVIAINVIGATVARAQLHGSFGLSVLAIGVVFGGLWVGYGFLRGVACRIISGLLLLGAAITHTAEVYHVLKDHAFAGAYVASLGYLLCAIGCFVGPRYIQPYQGPALPPPVIPPPMLPYH
jgi:hypothetical protein